MARLNHHRDKFYCNIIRCWFDPACLKDGTGPAGTFFAAYDQDTPDIIVIGRPAKTSDVQTINAILYIETYRLAYNVVMQPVYMDLTDRGIFQITNVSGVADYFSGVADYYRAHYGR